MFKRLGWALVVLVFAAGMVFLAVWSVMVGDLGGG